MLPVAATTSDGLRKKVLVNMTEDRIKAAAISDELIMKYASRLYFTHARDKHKFDYIKQQIRHLGAFLITAKEMDRDINKLMDCIDATKFELAVRAVRKLAGFNDESCDYLTPSKALKIGYALKRCAEIESSNALLRLDYDHSKNCDTFIALCTREWSYEVSNHAHQTLHRRKLNKPQCIPFSADIVKLQKYLKRLGAKLYSELKKKISAGNWSEFAQVLLASVVLFNRRRGGEAEHMTVQNWQSVEQRPLQDDIAASLTEFEKLLCNTLTRVEIVGKCNKLVPMIITPTLKKYIDLLVQSRETVGVLKDNIYVFARVNRGSLSSIRSSDCLGRFAQEAGTEYPHYLTSTKLRKHVATVSQILNLSENELDILATHLGHRIDVHREFYRLPSDTLQVAKVSKLLLAMEQGTLSKYAGKSLNEITMKDIDEGT